MFFSSHTFYIHMFADFQPLAVGSTPTNPVIAYEKKDILIIEAIDFKEAIEKMQQLGFVPGKFDVTPICKTSIK